MSSDTSSAQIASRTARGGAPRSPVCWPRAAVRIPRNCGEPPERLLDSPTYEGFPIRPLYTALDAQPEAPLPGQWPFIRGGDALRDVMSGWKVVETFPARDRSRRPTATARCWPR